MERVGDINGWGSILFKINLILLPLLLSSLVGVGVWSINRIFELKQDLAVLTEQVSSFIAAGPRYTPTHARADRVELKAEILKEIEKDYPPQWLRDTVESLNRRVESLERNGND